MTGFGSIYERHEKTKYPWFRSCLYVNYKNVISSKRLFQNAGKNLQTKTNALIILFKCFCLGIK